MSNITSSSEALTACPFGHGDLPRFPQARVDPMNLPPEYFEWQRTEPIKRVMWNGSPAWLVTDRTCTRALLVDKRTSSDINNPAFKTNNRSLALMRKAYTTFQQMDPPEHTAERKAVSGEFTVRQIEKMRPKIEALANRLIDRMLDKGHPADLIADFAMPLPCDVICSLLGAPESDYPRILDWSRRMNSNTTSEEEARQLIKEFCDEYLSNLVKMKDSSPGDDLLSRLAVSHLRTGKLTLHKIVALARVFLTAGHETTTGTIGLGMAALLTHPDQLSKLKADPSLIGNAVEEILRYSTAPHIGRLRVATEDFEMANVRIARGDALIMSTTTADRDPGFIDRPHEFDITRDPKDYLVFGTGIHMCLGQPLARLELQIAVGALVGRIPAMKLASPISELKFNANSPVYGLEALPVVW